METKPKDFEMIPLHIGKNAFWKGAINLICTQKYNRNKKRLLYLVH